MAIQIGNPDETPIENIEKLKANLPATLIFSEPQPPQIYPDTITLNDETKVLISKFYTDRAEYISAKISLTARINDTDSQDVGSHFQITDNLTGKLESLKNKFEISRGALANNLSSFEDSKNKVVESEIPSEWLPITLGELINLSKDRTGMREPILSELKQILTIEQRVKQKVLTELKTKKPLTP